MKNKIIALFSLCLILVLGLSSQAYSKTRFQLKGKQLQDLILGSLLENQIVVKFKKGVSVKTQKEVAKQVNAVSIRRIKGSALTLHFQNKIFYRRAFAVLKGNPLIEYVERNSLIKASYTPNDPRNSSQWAFRDIKIPEAWDVAISNGWFNLLNNNITVAVVDTGVDLDHPDLADTIKTNTSEIASNGVDDDSNGYIDDAKGYNWSALSNFPFPSDPLELIKLLTSYSSFEIGSSYPDTNIGQYSQSFQGTGNKISTIALFLSSYGDPKKPLRVSIRPSSGGVPANTELASVNIFPSDIPSIYPEEKYRAGLVEKSLSTTVNLDNGSTYFIVLSTKNKSFQKHYTTFGVGNSTTDYFDSGNFWLHLSDSWLEQSNMDLLFFSDATSADSNDDNGHGTHVAGIVGATYNNSQGVSGMSPGVRIMPLKVLDESGSGTNAGVARAIYYAADNGAKVINLSLGGSLDSKIISDSINYAYKKGAAVVAAAGNKSYDNYYYDEAPTSTTDPYEFPAANQHVLGVGATTADGTIAGFSVQNSSVDISAPGDYIFSTYFDDKYQTLSGTSMASPHVAGLVAMLMQKNPTWGIDKITRRIEMTADTKLPWYKDVAKGNGKINALEALTTTKEFSNIYSSTRGLTKLNYGKKIKITGSLKGSGWPPSTPLRGKNIRLWASVTGGDFFRVVAQTKTAKGGKFSFKVMPSVNTLYRVTWTGSKDYLRAIRDFSVKVRPTVKLQASQYLLEAKKPNLLSGKVSPDHADMKVSILFSKDKKRYRVLTRAQVNKGRYSAKITALKGTYYYKAKLPAHIDNLAGYSNIIKIKAY